MKLFEFFGHINLDLDKDHKNDSKDVPKEVEKQMGDELFWYIIDHDDLHKKYFMPNAKKVKESPDEYKGNWKIWAPMVNSGCMKYWKEQRMKKHPEDAFPKEMRKDLCKRIAEHYYEDIIKDSYNLGG